MGALVVVVSCEVYHHLVIMIFYYAACRAYVRYDPASSQYHAQSTGVQRSSRLLSMKSANCLLHLVNILNYD